MLEYRAEGLCRNANHLSKAELDRCVNTGEILQSTALAYDTEHRLRFELCGQRAYMPHDECLEMCIRDRYYTDKNHAFCVRKRG